ncbi:MAG: hypothetical protein FJW35_16660 [Acidobacteria bacterium]|nr:hypothetical protein [Acidobacteriota bacterium]
MLLPLEAAGHLLQFRGLCLHPGRNRLDFGSIGLPIEAGGQGCHPGLLAHYERIMKESNILWRASAITTSAPPPAAGSNV